jgi:uncharacterized protein YyaL (SSP411 family)
VPNRLASATSPYLLQHATNPVDWWEWGPAAFAEARRRNVPVLLSVGYAACHWCHVMAHESFEDEATAAAMNAKFVNIKVDREERPDVDAVYMQVTQELTGHGGWPMTVFLDHDARPFYAGTYYPPEPRGGMPSFQQILAAIDDAWLNRRPDLDTSAASITAGLADRAVGFGTDEEFNDEVVGDALAALARQFDSKAGGFGRAPKFPPSATLMFLARHHARTGSAEADAMFVATAEAMARGGMYDQLGGGFARYSVDSDWVVPHFEKMLYDNAQLLSVYTAWFKSGRSPMASRIVRETVEFLLRELLTDQGGFASALDADSDGAEGTFYVWSPEQIQDVLGEADAAFALSIFGVTPEGTFEEGASTLQLPSHPGDFERYQRIRSALFEARTSRTRPARDDKVITAWNGLAIGALAEAGEVFGEPSWVQAAQRCAELITSLHLEHRADGTVQLRRTSKDGVAGHALGVLEDYGDLAQGLLTLYSATGDRRWVRVAGELLTAVETHFVAAPGQFYDTAADAEALVQRPRDPADNAYPSGHSAVAGAMLTFAALTGDLARRDTALAGLSAVVPLMRQAPRFAGWSLAVGEAALDGPREVAIVGHEGDQGRSDLVRAHWQTPTAGAVLAVGPPETAEPAVDLLEHRGLVQGCSAAYVCRQFVCQAPVTDADDLVRLLGANT